MIAKFTLPAPSKALVAQLVRGSNQYKRTVDKAIENIAREAVRRVKEVITAQTFGNAVLSEGWAARKRNKGLDPRVLIATKAYFDSFDVRQVSSGVWGVLADEQKLAWLEKKTPRREHWTPVYAQMQIDGPALFAKEVLRAVFGD